MGLDLVEFVIALEASFGIDIPDRDAARLETPRHVIDYLAGCLPVAKQADTSCLSQRAFYRARGAVAQRFGLVRNELTPTSNLRAVLGDRADEWKELGQQVGANAWPRLKSQGRWFAHAGGVTTLGELAHHLSTYDVASLRGADAPWTRAEIEAVVLRVLVEETGVDMSRYTLDSTFVSEMGLD